MTETQERNVDGYTFGKWLSIVDAVLWDQCGLTHRDLPDGPSYDSWDSGMSPEEYALYLLYGAGFPMEMLRSLRTPKSGPSTRQGRRSRDLPRRSRKTLTFNFLRRK